MNISMILYFSILSLYIFISIIIRNRLKRDKLFLNLAFTLLFVVLAIRVPYSDMNNYLNYFHKIHQMNFSEFLSFKIEFLYKLLNLIIGKIYFNDRFFMIIIAIITCIGPYCFIKRYSENYLLSILLFISIGTYSLQFFVIRQAIAITFLLLSLKYIEKKNLKKFLILVGIATLFHYSSCFFVFIYYFDKIPNKTKILLSVLLFIGTILFKEQLYGLIGYTSYNTYMDIGIQGEGYGMLSLLIILLLFSLLFKLKDNENEMETYLSMSIMATILQIMATRISIFSRLVYDFINGLIVLPVNRIKNIKDKHLRRIISTIIIISGFIFLYNWSGIYGYNTIFK